MLTVHLKDVLLGELGDVPDTGSEIGRSVQLDQGKATSVGCDDPGYPVAVRVGGVEVDVELVRNAADGRQPGAKAQHGELFVRVVVLDDLSDGGQRQFVLSGTSGEVVERLWSIGISIGACKESLYLLLKVLIGRLFRYVLVKSIAIVQLISVPPCT